eukprot:gb/GFBE01081702.1/.p1 GENE.gb/GFBE01081702.1/~~gb/GFBE01081702.1/.p1  ORF type:complete len:230 (+),score=44.69 gb/GFBE01081702.1/:1-690(+)
MGIRDTMPGVNFRCCVNFSLCVGAFGFVGGLLLVYGVQVLGFNNSQATGVCKPVDAHGNASAFVCSSNGENLKYPLFQAGIISQDGRRTEPCAALQLTEQQAGDPAAACSEIGQRVRGELPWIGCSISKGRCIAREVEAIDPTLGVLAVISGILCLVCGGSFGAWLALDAVGCCRRMSGGRSAGESIEEEPLSPTSAAAVVRALSKRRSALGPDQIPPAQEAKDPTNDI